MNFYAVFTLVFSIILLVHPLPAVKACVEHIILCGICQHLSESHITITSSIVNKYIANYENGADLPSEIIAITAAQLLAKILPILGEAIKSQLDEFLNSLLPALGKDSLALQTTVLRSLVLIGNADATIIEVILKQVYLQMKKQLDMLKEEKNPTVILQIMESDIITSYAKGIGELLILLYTSIYIHLILSFIRTI